MLDRTSVWFSSLPLSLYSFVMWLYPKSDSSSKTFFLSKLVSIHVTLPSNLYFPMDGFNLPNCQHLHIGVEESGGEIRSQKPPVLPNTKVLNFSFYNLGKSIYLVSKILVSMETFILRF